MWLFWTSQWSDLISQVCCWFDSCTVHSGQDIRWTPRMHLPTFSMGAWGRLQGRLYSCLTNELSSSTVSWLHDLPLPKRYLRERVQKVGRRTRKWLFSLSEDARREQKRKETRARSSHLVCLLPFSSCCATVAHFSASCVTRRSRRSRSLSGNNLDSDSLRRVRNTGRPAGRTFGPWMRQGKCLAHKCQSVWAAEVRIWEEYQPPEKMFQHCEEVTVQS